MLLLVIEITVRVFRKRIQAAVRRTADIEADLAQ